MAEVRKLKCKPKTRTIGEVIGVIKANLGSEYVCEANMLGGKAVLLCFEQYYFRCSNYVSLSIMLTETEEWQEVVVAGFGGGDGLLNHPKEICFREVRPHFLGFKGHEPIKTAATVCMAPQSPNLSPAGSQGPWLVCPAQAPWWKQLRRKVGDVPVSLSSSCPFRTQRPVPGSPSNPCF